MTDMGGRVAKYCEFNHIFDTFLPNLVNFATLNQKDKVVSETSVTKIFQNAKIIKRN